MLARVWLSWFVDFEVHRRYGLWARAMFQCVVLSALDHQDNQHLTQSMHLSARRVGAVSQFVLAMSLGACNVQ